MISHSVDAAMTQTPLYILFKYVDLKKQKTYPFNPVYVVLLFFFYYKYYLPSLLVFSIAFWTCVIYRLRASVGKELFLSADASF